MRIKKILMPLTSTRLYFWASLWLMIILIIGTVAQRELGLYQAQLKYFNSWFFWEGPLPLPGGIPTLGIIFLGLFFQLLFKTKFLDKNKIGISITHLGVFLLLLGGIITNFSSIEGSMIIPEGKSSNYFEDYHLVELAISSPESVAGTGPSLIIPEKQLKAGAIFIADHEKYSIKILKYFKNITLRSKGHNNPLDKSLAKIELNQQMEIVSKVQESNENENIQAVEFQVSGSANDGVFVVYKDMDQYPTLTTQKGAHLLAIIRNLRHPLPFTITLNDFEKLVYPSSQIPKSFKSAITLHDEKIDQKIVIQMNEPLRYKGYTFYQSSFSQNSEGEITDLAVVKNAGKFFPYISSIIICVGILIHLFSIRTSPLSNKGQDE